MQESFQMCSSWLNSSKTNFIHISNETTKGYCSKIWPGLAKYHQAKICLYLVRKKSERPFLVASVSVPMANNSPLHKRKLHHMLQ